MGGKVKRGKRRIRIIENPIYCDILFRLGKNRRYVRDFLNDFIDDLDSLGEKEEPYKKESVLLRQMDLLREEDFIKTTKVDEEGDKLPNNRKDYYVNFEKIIDLFIDYCISEERGDKKELENKKFKDEAKNNFFIRFLFEEAFDDVRRTGHTREINIKDIYEIFLSLGYVDDTLKHRIFDLYEIKTKKELLVKDLKNQREYVNKDLKKEYDFFLRFFNVISKAEGIRYFINYLIENEIPARAVYGLKKDISGPLMDETIDKMDKY